MKFHVYRDARNEWRWHLKSANGNKIADSGEGYINIENCFDGIQLVMDTHRQTQVEVDQDPGTRRWGSILRGFE